MSMNGKAEKPPRQPPSHLLKLSVAEQKKFLDSFDVVLSDCDGVLWYFSGYVPRSGESVNVLRNAGKEFKFTTNNSYATDQKLLQKFEAIGVRNVSRDDIFSSIKAVTHYLKTYHPNERVISICSDAAHDLFRENNIDFKPVEVPPNFNPVDILEVVRIKENSRVVAIDANTYTGYGHLAIAEQYLKQENAVFICGGMDYSYPLPGNNSVFGFAYFLNILSERTNKTLVVCAKPSTLFGDIIKEKYKITNPKRCLYIGDSLTQDIGFANASGFQSLLVLSGTSSKEELLEASEAERPDYYADSIADFIEVCKNCKI